jgi:hypothetical protein
MNITNVWIVAVFSAVGGFFLGTWVESRKTVAVVAPVAQTIELKCDPEELASVLAKLGDCEAGATPAAGPQRGRAAAAEWDTRIADKHRPGRFVENLRAAVADCGNGEVTYIDAQCDAPPCLGRLRVPGGGLFSTRQMVDDCPTWSRVYGTDVIAATGEATCAGGRRESYLILGASTVSVLGPAPDAAAAAKRTAEVQGRVSAAQSPWPCAD